MDVILIAITVILVTCLWLLIRRPPHPVDQLPGPPTIPFFGNALNFAKPPPEAFEAINKNCRKFRKIFRIWLTKFMPVVYPLDPKYVETIMSSSEHISKSSEYKTIEQWLGIGLLISDGSKWHSRRKLLTPAFHFSILEQFVPVFCDKSRVLVEKLRNAANSNPDGVDIVPLVTRCALEMICETAMGYPIIALDNDSQKYISALHEIGEIVCYRSRRPWLIASHWIFGLTAAGRRQKECLKILHNFTDMVIRKRREEMQFMQNNDLLQASEKNFGKKKRTAFLDLLLKVSEQDPTFDDKEIRAEVDTFMFEGHDTTAMGMSWTLYFISVHQDIQPNIYAVQLLG